MLNVMKSKMFLMVIIALIGAYIAYQYIYSKSSPDGTTVANTGNPLLDHDINTVKTWFNFDCFGDLYGQDYGKGKPNQTCINALKQNVKQATGQDITDEQILNPKVREILVKRY